jgi:N-acetylmuramoyl-L-alanine amidase
MGFLTNAQERQKLCTDEYQTTMAQSVVASIVRSLG